MQLQALRKQSSHCQIVKHCLCLMCLYTLSISHYDLTADSAVHTYLVVRVQLCVLPQQLQSHLPQEQGQAPQQLRKQTHV